MAQVKRMAIKKQLGKIIAQVRLALISSKVQAVKAARIQIAGSKVRGSQVNLVALVARASKDLEIRRATVKVEAAALDKAVAVLAAVVQEMAVETVEMVVKAAYRVAKALVGVIYLQFHSALASQTERQSTEACSVTGKR